MMGNISSLSLEEYQKYAQASTVNGFYYTLSASLNGSDSFEPVSLTSSESVSAPDMPDGIGGGKFNKGQTSQGDFSITGYSDDTAMTDFINGNSSITDGQVFPAGTAEAQCIISSELAAYNSVSVGDTVILTNPNNESETYSLTVVGIYESTEQSDFRFEASSKENRIYMSYTALNAIVDRSKELNTTVTDDDGNERQTALTSSLNATYTFASVEDYDTFAQEVYTLGLDSSYTVSSSDLTAFENSLIPLETLSKMAGYFLVVILIIGASILVVLNIFSIRERKYEIGVLTAMGMKKGKVALQFLTEIFAVTLVAVTIGIGVGAVSSVPMTNALLENQIESQSNTNDRLSQSFGRENEVMPQIPVGDKGDMNTPDMGGEKGFFGGASEYITEINSAMNLTVVLQMLGIAILLTLIAGAAGILSVMRYEPLKILSNRD